MDGVKNKRFVLTAAHCRSARGLFHLTQQQVAEAAGVSERTIQLFEAEERRSYRDTLKRIQVAFEKRNIEFLNSGSLGVRLRGEDRASE